MMRHIALLPLFVSTLLALDSVDVEKEYRVAVLKEWPPYYQMRSQNRPDGYASELFDRVALRIGIKYRYIAVDDWKDALKLLDEGWADIIPNIGITAERAKEFSFTEPTDTFDINLFTLKNSESSLLRPLKEKRVGVVLTNVCNALIGEEITKNKIIYNDFSRAFDGLMDGEVDYFCYPRPLMEQKLSEVGMSERVEIVGEPITTLFRGIGVAKQHEHLVVKMNAVIAKMKIDGELARLQEKWFFEEKIALSYNELPLVIVLILLLIVLFVGLTLFVVTKKEWLLTKSALLEQLNQKILEVEEQNRLIATQSKIAAIGEMLGNIAHQWRQPLSVITMQMNNMKLSMELEEQLSKDDLEIIANNVNEQCHYLSQTIEDFRDFFRADIHSKGWFDVAKSMQKTFSLVKDSLKSNHIECVMNGVEDQLLYNNENLFIQMLLNICNNAKDAMLANKISEEERFILVSLQKKPNATVLSITDSGGGVDEAIKEKIFEPYFTTKHKSVGTGLGLYMSHEIATKHFGGNIEVYNRSFKQNAKELRGACFIVTLPLDDESNNL